MLLELEWQTKLTKVSLRRHWRLLLCAALGAALVTPAWYTVYPNVVGFEKLWVGMASGMAIGSYFGSIWQLGTKERRSATSGWLVLMTTVGWGLIAALALVFFKPQFEAEEKELAAIRSLAAGDISSISIHLRGQPARVIKDAELVASFVAHVRQARLFTRSHEVSALEFKIAIYLKNGRQLEYDGDIPEFHLRDLALGFWGPAGLAEIIIPNGRQWLDSTAPTEPRSTTDDPDSPTPTEGAESETE